MHRPRVALIMPARTAGIGGVQRFAECLYGAAQEVWSVDQVWFHPAAGVPRNLRTWAAAAAAGVSMVYRLHRQAPLDAILSTFHAPPTLLPGVPTFGFVHDLRSFGLQAGASPRGVRARTWSFALGCTIKSWTTAFVPSAHVALDVRTLAPNVGVAEVGEGLDHLDAEIFAAPETRRDSVLAIAGRSPHKRGLLGLEALERAVDALGCRGILVGKVGRSPRDARIEVHEEPSDAEMARLYCQARVALLPTSYEGFGLAAGEAMWFGAPVVFAEDCPLHALVGSGGVAARPDAASLARAVVSVWARSEEIGRSATRNARRYTWRSTVDRMSAVMFSSGLAEPQVP